ncbi:telomerase reverse transcriptase (macronuclear) [Tetrahymena thermophila SB210]|uniref:Telomerase reverse transcriptase n=1 Tax=Tetrahymena thermophila (strain SB210) TaxID=312017 RepID=TERT_TETTS|nr:telomerase reverse transcriptase [Tetrahymena thermophila SB210]O77448.1 RecName: Full=Telomerase reverse transcriptase; AltName: Full=Telomerase catalytic subunit; AltName: Full=Telomerase subunit P133 [Tetrahymena thermophila SB210]6D6V_A Chain A, Telomerase reverse transcriptase [Tetrahymena thermophila]7LMA_A Chain A, Telomerase reverse transcriptase [Tetrahymena thermophila]7LMB_A Chain A, Telomerase reverse transcriptase [Tetrahymena thermophila]7UY5_A Chain A, Telomerase reverse tran|eukprot:XP_001010651.3 telomerase reverse transcriptase [Tetrahymena thermophila SB210]
MQKINNINNNKQMLTRKEDLLTVLKQISALKYVSNLYEFLLATEKIVQTSELDTQFQEFLTTTIIASEQNLVENYKQKYNQPNFSQLTIKQVIDDSIILLGNKQNYVQQIGTTTIGFYVEYENINLSRQTLYSSNFRNLLNIFGEEDFKYFLIDFLVFTKVEQNGYLQVAGVCLNQYFSVQVKQKKWYKNNFNMNGKATSNNNQNNANLSNEKKQENQYIYPEIQRSQIFYCNHMGREPGVFKSSFFNYSEIKKGFQFKVIQEKLQGRQFINSDKIKPDHPQTIIKKTLLKEYQSKNFSCQEERDLFLEFTEKIVQNFHNINFNYLLKKFCKLPENYQSLKSQVKQIVQSENKANQQSCENLFNSLYDTEISYKQITNFLRQIIQNCVPNQLLGKKNFKVFLEKLYEFVQMKRFENQKVLDYICFMDVFDVEWFVDLKNQKFTQKRKYISDKRKILGDLIVFIINKIVIPVLRYNFYITEKHKEGSQIFYYRKPIWKLVSKLTIVKLEEENLEKVEEKLIPEDSFQKYPQGKLRIIPKKGSFRPIMTFLRKDKQKNIKLNLNQILMDSQLVFRNLKDMLGQKIGYSVFDNKQISEKFAQFIEKWKNKGRPQLYYVTLDIKKCYDSIDQMKLLNFFNQSDLIQDTYFINKYLLFQRNKRPLLQIQQTNNLNSAMEIEEEKINKKPFKMDNINFPYYFNLKERQIAYSLYDDDDQILQKGFKEIQSDDRPFIVINQDKPRCITKDIIHNHLKHISQYNVISFNKVKFRQKRGIPQGLNISGVLCSFYFGKLEEEYTQFLKNAEQVNGSINLLMRLTDDYLFISDSQQNALNLIVQLQNCANNNGFMFNDQKITTNFQFPQEDYNLEHFKISVQNECQWIGKSIDMNTLEIKSIQKQTQQEINQTINVAISIKNLKSQLKNKLRSLFLNQLIDYFNPNINSFEGLCRQLYHHSKATVMKFYPFMTKLFQIDLKKSKQYSVQYGKENTNENFLKDILYYTVEDVCKILCYLQFEDEINSNIKEIFKNLYSWIMWDIIVSYLKKKKQFKGYLNKLLQKIRKSRFFYLKEGCKSLQLILSQQKYQLNKKELEAIEFIDLNNLIQDIKTLIPKISAKSNQQNTN